MNATYSLSQLPYIPNSPFGIEPADAAANLIQFGTYQPVQMVTNLFAGQVSPVGDGTVERNSKIPYSEQGSLEIDREIGHGLVRQRRLSLCFRSPSGSRGELERLPTGRRYDRSVFMRAIR